MIIRLVRASGSPELVVEEAADLKRLALAARQHDVAMISSALDGHRAGSVSSDDDHVWIDLAWLGEQVRQQDPGLVERFDEMVAYADRHGWVDASKESVRVHVDIDD